MRRRTRGMSDFIDSLAGILFLIGGIVVLSIGVFMIIFGGFGFFSLVGFIIAIIGTALLFVAKRRLYAHTVLHREWR